MKWRGREGSEQGDITKVKTAEGRKDEAGVENKKREELIRGHKGREGAKDRWAEVGDERIKS